MQRPELLGLRLAQWGVLALATILLLTGWGVVAYSLRLGPRTRRAGVMVAALVVALVAVIMVVRAA